MLYYVEYDSGYVLSYREKQYRRVIRSQADTGWLWPSKDEARKRAKEAQGSIKDKYTIRSHRGKTVLSLLQAPRWTTESTLYTVDLQCSKCILEFMLIGDVVESILLRRIDVSSTGSKTVGRWSVLPPSFLIQYAEFPVKEGSKV